jgi:hypothetical protein
VITIAMSTVVHSPRDRVWRALTSPSELIRWDERKLSLEEPVNGYPSTEHAARWRYQLGSVAVELFDQPLEVMPRQRLRHAMSIGSSFAFEEIYTLVDDGGGENTRLSLRLASSSNSIPLVGGTLDRFDVRRLASEIVDGSLRSIQKWCENHP